MGRGGRSRAIGTTRIDRRRKESRRRKGGRRRKGDRQVIDSRSVGRLKVGGEKKRGDIEGPIGRLSVAPEGVELWLDESAYSSDCEKEREGRKGNKETRLDWGEAEWVNE